MQEYQSAKLAFIFRSVYTMTLTAIKYDRERHVLSLLDQRCLPASTVYLDCTTSTEVSVIE